MTTLIFSISEVKKLVDELNRAGSFTATTDDLFNADFYPGGELRNEAGQTMAEVESKGGIFWPSSRHIDKSHLRPMLILENDHGVYLMTNAELEGSPASRRTVAYAAGMDPEKDDDWDYYASSVFGGDDSSTVIPVDWFKLAEERGDRSFKIKVCENSVRLAV